MKRVLKLPNEVWLDRSGLPPSVTTLREAIGLIDEHLTPAIRHRAHWDEARKMLLAAADSGKPRDVSEAATRFKSALRKEGWIVE